MTDAPLRMLRLDEVSALTTLSRSTILRLEQAGTFPRRRYLTARTIRWVEEEGTAWMTQQAAQP